MQLQLKSFGVHVLASLRQNTLFLASQIIHFFQVELRNLAMQLWMQQGLESSLWVSSAGRIEWKNKNPEQTRKKDNERRFGTGLEISTCNLELAMHNSMKQVGILSYFEMWVWSRVRVWGWQIADAGGVEALTSGRDDAAARINVSEKLLVLERLNPTPRPTT